MYNFTKYQKQQWRVEDFGRGKSVIAKARIRRILKKQTKRQFYKEVLS